MKGQALKTLVKNYGLNETRRRLTELLTPDDKGHAELQPEDISLRELWEALIGPVSETLENAHGRMFSRGSQLIPMGVQESEGSAVMTASFTDITGVLLASKLIAGYNLPGYIGDLLLDTMPSRLQVERYAGFTALEQPFEVREGAPYKESGFIDKYATSEALKKGRLLNITEEAIYFDRTGQLLKKAMDLGEKARLERETVMLNCATDRFAGAGRFIYSPLGVGEALYRLVGTATSPTVNQLAGNALVDWTDIDNVLQVFAAMNDENGDPIVVFPKTILVPSALLMVAKRIVGATEIRTGLTTATETTLWANPMTGYQVVSSPLLDRISQTDWYLGDFKKQFVWHQVWPLQVMRTTLQEEKHLRDIVFSLKVRYFGGAASIDDKYVVQS